MSIKRIITSTTDYPKKYQMKNNTNHFITSETFTEEIKNNEYVFHNETEGLLKKELNKLDYVIVIIGDEGSGKKSLMKKILGYSKRNKILFKLNTGIVFLSVSQSIELLNYNDENNIKTKIINLELNKDERYRKLTYYKVLELKKQIRRRAYKYNKEDNEKLFSPISDFQILQDDIYLELLENLPLKLFDFIQKEIKNIKNIGKNGIKDSTEYSRNIKEFKEYMIDTPEDVITVNISGMSAFNIYEKIIDDII
jgi:hypothetical protein